MRDLLEILVVKRQIYVVLKEKENNYLERGFDLALSELFAVFKKDVLPCLLSLEELAADMSLLPLIHMKGEKEEF